MTLGVKRVYGPLPRLCTTFFKSFFLSLYPSEDEFLPKGRLYNSNTVKIQRGEIKVRVKVELKEDSESERKRYKESKTKRIARVKENSKESKTKRIARIKESSKRRTFPLRGRFCEEETEERFRVWRKGEMPPSRLRGFAPARRRKAAPPVT